MGFHFSLFNIWDHINIYLFFSVLHAAFKRTFQPKCSVQIKCPYYARSKSKSYSSTVFVFEIDEGLEISDLVTFTSLSKCLQYSEQNKNCE